MILEKNNLCLDHIKCTNEKQKEDILPVADGLVIRAKDIDSKTGYMDIAYIYWSDVAQDCYIQTIDDRFQTYIVLYDTFTAFIYLIDEAYRMISLVHNQTPLKY